MTRFWIAGGVLALALTIYCLVDLTVTDDRRIRSLNRVLWVVVIAVVPVIGPLLWLTRGKAPIGTVRPLSPDDDPSFSGAKAHSMSDAEADRRIREIEAQLAALESEADAPGEASVPEEGSIEPDPAPADDRPDGAARQTPQDPDDAGRA